jgi:hypothetical protein
MKKPLLYALIGLGALELFLAAMVAFAHVLGAELDSLPLIGALFPADEPPAEPAVAAEPGRDAITPPGRLARLGVLETFSMESPYSASELAELVGELERRREEIELRHAELDEREQRLESRAELLDEKYADLRELFVRLEERAAELDLRAAEVQRDESAASEREASGWRTLAQLFAEGDAEDLSGRLLRYEPAAAARILSQLEPDRAKELLDALPPERWQPYAEAYSGHSPGQAQGDGNR